MRFIFFSISHNKQKLKKLLINSKTVYATIFFLILSSTVFSQTLIKGSVKNSENVNMQNVSVLLMNESEDLLNYASTNKNGSFSFEVYDSTRKFLVFRAIGYDENKI